jgi:hypothetical protein
VAGVARRLARPRVGVADVARHGERGRVGGGARVGSAAASSWAACCSGGEGEVVGRRRGVGCELGADWRLLWGLLLLGLMVVLVGVVLVLVWVVRGPEWELLNRLAHRGRLHGHLLGFGGEGGGAGERHLRVGVRRDGRGRVGR